MALTMTIKVEGIDDGEVYYSGYATGVLDQSQVLINASVVSTVLDGLWTLSDETFKPELGLALSECVTTQYSKNLTDALAIVLRGSPGGESGAAWDVAVLLRSAADEFEALSKKLAPEG